MTIKDLMPGDIVSFNDIVSGYSGTFIGASPYNEDGNCYEAVFTCGRFYFDVNADLEKLYELKFCLKVCPFCSADESKLAIPGCQDNPDEPEQVRFCVYCKGCDTEGPMGNNHIDAIRRWNKRA